MTTYIRAACIAGLALSLGACATITRGQHTAFEVKTKPVGAAVKTTNGFACASTPCSLTIERKAEFDATITKAGYKPLVVHVTHKIGSGGGVGMAGNVLVGGLIGAAVDAGSGAMYDLTPNPIDVELEPETASAATPAATAPAPATPAAAAPAATTPAATTPAAEPAPASPAPATAAKPTDSQGEQ